MRQVVGIEQSRSSRVPASLAAPGPDAPSASSAKPNPDAPPFSADVERPVFREVQAGETRVEGMLERIDCAAGRITLSLRLPDRVARFQAAAFTAIEFISYRADLRGAIACASRTPPDRVYLTWRAGDLDGTVVAVEFLAPVK
jgi:hypothetical protein